MKIRKKKNVNSLEFMIFFLTQSVRFVVLQQSAAPHSRNTRTALIYCV